MLLFSPNILSSRLLSKNLKNKIYKTIILPVSLYGCEAWSLTLREEWRLQLSENRILRRIFGPKSGEFQNVKRHSLYRSPKIVRVTRFRRLQWARMEEGRSDFKILTGKPTGKRFLGRPRRRWEDNIGMDLK